jgi:hypothetical protein
VAEMRRGSRFYFDGSMGRQNQFPVDAAFTRR